MKRSRKKYERPRRSWDKARIEREKEILKRFGLRKKRELWRTEAILRKYRRIARDLIGKREEKREKMLLEKLIKLGVLREGATLDDVLALTVEDFLERRIQTFIFRKGMANSIKHARQLIAHGNVKINSRKILYPNYMVSIDEENKIEVEK